MDNTIPGRQSTRVDGFDADITAKLECKNV